MIFRSTGTMKMGEEWGLVWPPEDRAMEPGRSGGEPEPPKYLLPIIGLLVLFGLHQLVPALGSNEVVYLLVPRAIADPGFLPGYLESRPQIITAFWGIGAGLFVLLKDPVLVALVGRVLGWVFVLHALSRVCRVLGIGPGPFFAAVALWFLTGQNLGAGEWVIQDFEQKVFAYGFLFLGLEGLMTGRLLYSGLCSGMAVAFHVLVGGWGTIALFAAVAASVRAVGVSGLLSFSGAAFITGFPFIALALQTQVAPVGSPSPPPAGFDPLAVVVLFRNPHHLDPFSFLSVKKALQVLVLGVGVFIWTWVPRRPSRGRILGVFVGVALLIFVLGVLARMAGALFFLNYYPFRVADVLLPLLFWVVGMEFAVRTVRGMVRSGGRHLSPSLPALAMLALFLAGSLEMSRDVVPKMRGSYAAMVDGWSAYLAKQREPFDAMADWIQGHTEGDAVFAAPPCDGSFTMKAGRRVVVSYKSGPSAGHAYAWYQRLERMNGGALFNAAGADICPTLDRNFNELDLEQLAGVRDDFSADYYLTLTERADLADVLVHGNPPYFLYDLRRLGG